MIHALDLSEIPLWFDEKIVPLYTPGLVPEDAIVDKIREEMAEFDEDPSDKEAFDVLASLVCLLWYRGTNIQDLVDVRMGKLFEREWELEGTSWHSRRDGPGRD